MLRFVITLFHAAVFNCDVIGGYKQRRNET